MPYFAMELVAARRCKALPRPRRPPGRGRRAARIVAQVAEALDYAHHKGVIHRDLKPSNVMLERSGAVKVMDYGIARAQHLEGLTTTGSFLGTPSYAAPETVDAASQPASDLYSLGVVFFEMLTGSLPFQGDNAFAVMRTPLRHAAARPLLAQLRPLRRARPDRAPPAQQGARRASDGRAAAERARPTTSRRPVRRALAVFALAALLATATPALAQDISLNRPGLRRPGGGNGQRLHRRLGRRNGRVVEPGGPLPAAQARVLPRPQHQPPRS